MRDMVVLLGGWIVFLYLVGLGIGYAARWLTCIAHHRQERAYRRTNGGHPPPRSAKRGLGMLTAVLVSVAALLIGVLSEYLGIRPPGTQGFTFWAYIILVMPGCIAGAAWGAALAVSKGPLPRWYVPSEGPVDEPVDRTPRRRELRRRPIRGRDVGPGHYPGFETR
jgi:ABC-type Fe3+ transport system permease subunit